MSTWGVPDFVQDIKGLLNKPLVADYPLLGRKELIAMREEENMRRDDPEIRESVLNTSNSFSIYGEVNPTRSERIQAWVNERLPFRWRISTQWRPFRL